MTDFSGSFGILNWTILLVYIVFNLGIGFVLSKKVSTAEDFYVGRKTTPWWAIGVSVIATYVSALTFLGAPAWAYTDGLSVMAIHLNYPLVIFFVVTFFLPFFYNSGVASIYEYHEKRFGPKARSLIAAIFLVSQTVGSAAILYATSLVLQFITGIDVNWAIVIVTVVALIYTTMGGTIAVVWTDVFQAAILFVGAIIVFYLLTDQLTSPMMQTLSEIKAAGRLQALDFSSGFDHVTSAWAGIIAMTLYHTTVYGTNQMMVQRTLAAKNIGDAKKSYLLMGFVAFFIYFLFIFMGVLFWAHYDGREFENGNTIILHFAAEFGMPGLMGIIAAAVMAASMSSLSSAFSSLSTIATVDFYERYISKNAAPEHYLKVTRWFTVIFGVLTILPAIAYSKSEGSILEILSQVGSFFVGAQLGMYALGFFSRQATERGLLVGTIAGFGVVWWVATQTDVSWPWYCLVGAVSNIIVTLLASRIIDGRQEQWSPYSVVGQKAKFLREGRAEKDGGWFLVPGRVDGTSWWLLVFFALTLLALYLLNTLVP